MRQKCHNCHGTGVITRREVSRTVSGNYKNFEFTVICPVCQGVGHYKELIRV